MTTMTKFQTTEMENLKSLIAEWYQEVLTKPPNDGEERVIEITATYSGSYEEDAAGQPPIILLYCKRTNTEVI